MHNISVEHRQLDSESQVAANIAQHICQYQVYGKMVIVADDPAALLADLETAWRSLKREMRQRVDQLPRGEKQSRLVNQLQYMGYCNFAAKAPIDDPSEQVIVATPAEVLEWAPLCQTIFITCDMPTDELHRATSWMPRYGLIITYHYK